MTADIAGLLEDLVFPMTREELIAHIGTHEIDHPTGTSETVAEICGRIDADVYHSRDDALLALCCGLSGEAIGRKHYSDRDPPIHGVEPHSYVSV